MLNFSNRPLLTLRFNFLVGLGLGLLGLVVANDRVQFDPPRGVYDLPIDLTLSHGAGVTIRYTLDGSEPTSTSPVYSQPLPVSAITSVRATAFFAGGSNSLSTTHT